MRLDFVLLRLLLPVWFLPATAQAHQGTAHSSWNLDPVIILPLMVLSLGYARGLSALRRKAGPDRAISSLRAASFFGGIAAIVSALLSPIDPLSDELASIHMIQHMILMSVAAPLIVIGRPLFVLLWSLPLTLRKPGIGRISRISRRRLPLYLLWQPLLLWIIYACALWIPHLPSLYEAALHNEWLHHLQHLVFFLTSCVFWRVLLDPIIRLRRSGGTALLYLFATSLHAMFLGVFMVYAESVWYPSYIGRSEAWGLSALEDQQLAGLIMWMPAGLGYVIVAAYVFLRWLLERRRSMPATYATVKRG